MERRAINSSRWLDGLTIAAACGMMLAWTWRTWPDPLVDFGRELYVPWQLTIGRFLYRDIAYFNGPLSPYLNAGWMRLFGVSLNTIIAANLMILAVVLALLYALLNDIAGRIAALVGALVFVALFGFGRLTLIGNYNFVCPYSHETTHGIALSLGALACLHIPRRLEFRNVAISGLLVGLVFLTKVEVALACGVAVAAGFALRAVAETPSRRPRLAAMLVATTLTPGVFSFALLCTRLPASAALKGTLGSIYWTLFSNLSNTPFYRTGMGLDDLRGNLVQMCAGVALLGAAVLVAAGIGLLASRITGQSHSVPVASITFITTVGLGIGLLRSSQWFLTLPKALPVAMILLMIAWIVAYGRGPASTDQARILAGRIALSVFALCLLAKMIFNTRLYHYGFALAMPATLLLVAAFVSWWPQIAATRGANRVVVRAVGLALAVLMTSAYLMAMAPALLRQHYPVGSGSDAFLADERGQAVQVALNSLQKLPADATLAVLPEGVMINYLSRRSNPTPYVNLMPPELLMFGEDQVVRVFENSPPDFVLLCHKDTTEYGAPLFGRDYGENFAAWINENYYPEVLIGNRPLQYPDRFGILLLRRR